MTVKELFQSLELKDIIEPMKKKYPDALLPLSEYKENYDIILNTVFSGEGGTITFRPDGNSNAYMTEGDRYFNIVGMEVVLPDNGAVTTAEAAAEILWCSRPSDVMAKSTGETWQIGPRSSSLASHGGSLHCSKQKSALCPNGLNSRYCLHHPLRKYTMNLRLMGSQAALSTLQTCCSTHYIIARNIWGPARNRNVYACSTPHPNTHAPQPNKAESLKSSANTSARRHGSFSPASVKALPTRQN